MKAGDVIFALNRNKDFKTSHCLLSNSPSESNECSVLLWLGYKIQLTTLPHIENDLGNVISLKDAGFWRQKAILHASFLVFKDPKASNTFRG